MNINQFRQQTRNESLRRRDLSTVQADHAVIPGRILVNAAGEAYADVDFSVRFTSFPSFTYGFELQEGQGIISGEMPTGSAHVSGWKTIERLPVSVFYTGATIQIVTTGQFYQKMILNFEFSGMAMTNPSI
jgi:hypothetical protein